MLFTVTFVLSTIPWRPSQQECRDIRRAIAHIREGSRPGKRSDNGGNIRKYICLCTLGPSALLVRLQSVPHSCPFQFSIVPEVLLGGPVTALHHRFSHASLTQLSNVFDR